MPWVRFDDDYPTNPKMRALGRNIPAKWLATVAVFFCSRHLTDGVINLQTDLELLCGKSQMPIPTIKRCIPELVRVGLWDVLGEGVYLVHDFLDYNPSAAEVKELRAARAEAGRLGGLRSGASRRSESEASASGGASRVLEPRTRTPTPKSKSAFVKEAVDNSLRNAG